MNWANTVTFLCILLYIQVGLTILGIALMLAVTLFVVIPEFGLQNVGRDRKRLTQFMKESKHPLVQWSNAVDPFAYWPINAPVVLYQRLIKHNRRSNFDNPYGKED